MTNINYGKVAWDAYAEAVGGKTFDDKPLPEWEDLGDRQRRGWAAAAISIAAHLAAASTGSEKDPRQQELPFPSHTVQADGTGGAWPWFDFGNALECLDQGLTVRRRGWNGKDMFLKLQVPDEHSKMTLPYIYISMPGKPSRARPVGPFLDLVPWLASQADMLAVDWEIVE